MLLGGIGVTLEMNPVYFCLQRSQKKKKEKPAWLFFWIPLLPFFKYWLNHHTWHLHLTLRLTQVWGAHSRLPPTPALHPLWVYTAHEDTSHPPAQPNGDGRGGSPATDPAGKAAEGRKPQPTAHSSHASVLNGSFPRSVLGGDEMVSYMRSSNSSMPWRAIVSVPRYAGGPSLEKLGSNCIIISMVTKNENITSRHLE